MDFDLRIAAKRDPLEGQVRETASPAASSTAIVLNGIPQWTDAVDKWLAERLRKHGTNASQRDGKCLCSA